MFTETISHTRSMSTNHERLGKLIFTRRHELGLTQENIEERGGPAPLTVSEYEKGKVPNKPQPRTLSRFDAALEWADGSSAAVLKGGDPIPLDVRALTLEARARNSAARDDAPNGTRWAVVDLDEVATVAIAALRLARQAEEVSGLPNALLVGIQDLRMSSATLMVSAISSRESDEGMARLADDWEARRGSR